MVQISEFQLNYFKIYLPSTNGTSADKIPHQLELINWQYKFLSFLCSTVSQPSAAFLGIIFSISSGDFDESLLT